MTPADAATHAARSSLTFEQAEYHYRQGYMTEDTWRWYTFFWTWLGPRFSSVAGADWKQERAYNRLPYGGLYRRYDRVRALYFKLRGEQPHIRSLGDTP